MESCKDLGDGDGSVLVHFLGHEDSGIVRGKPRSTTDFSSRPGSIQAGFGSFSDQFPFVLGQGDENVKNQLA